MSGAFGFSIGDIIAVLKIIGTVIDALRDSSSASSSFRSLINELYSLESALLRVKRLDTDVNHVENAALQQAASQCQKTIDTFYNKLLKYQPHLQQSGTDSRIKDAWAKIKWATCKKNDIDIFRAEIRGHTSSIEILLLTMQMQATTTHARKQDSQYKTLGRRIQDFSYQVMGKLSAITDGVAQSVQQGKALFESSAEIVQTNLRLFQVVRDIQLFILKIPGQVQRQQPVYLIDPFNRESPFHLEFVRSREALLAVLKLNLKETGCGPDMIDRNEFVIEEMGTQDSIDLTSSWDNCFYPGQRVAMSMVFKQQPTIFGSSCPRCGKVHVEPTGKEITCMVCGTIFRRVEEISERRRRMSEPDNSHGYLQSWDLQEIPAQEVARPRKRKRENDNALTNLRKFRRVRLMSTSTVSNHASLLQGFRCKVHESKNDDWIEKGTGLCTSMLKFNSPRLHVQSEEDPGHTLLETSIDEHKSFQRQKDTLVGWLEQDGTRTVLSFQDVEGSIVIWNFIQDALQRMLDYDQANDHPHSSNTAFLENVT